MFTKLSMPGFCINWLVNQHFPSKQAPSHHRATVPPAGLLAPAQLEESRVEKVVA